MTHAELVERVAKAIFKADGLVHGSEEKMFEAIEWEELDAADYQCIRDGYRARARAAIAECYRAMMEPTPEMHAAGRHSNVGPRSSAHGYIYTAMLSASPLNGGRHE